MEMSRALAYKAKAIAKAAYDRPQFELKHDSFYLEPEYDKKVLWVGVTGSNDRYDWWDNFLAFCKWFLEKLVKAHARWFNRAQRFESALTGRIHAALPNEDLDDWTIILVGHSYGGAAAQNYTLLNGSVRLCITFNSPKPWKEFNDKPSELLMREKCHHFVNTADGVTSMPFRCRRFGKEYLWCVNVTGIDHGIDLNDVIIDKYFPDV